MKQIRQDYKPISNFYQNSMEGPAQKRFKHEDDNNYGEKIINMDDSKDSTNLENIRSDGETEEWDFFVTFD